MLGVLSIGLITSCANAEQQLKVNALVEKQKELKNELMDAYKAHKAGKLTTEDLAKLSMKIQDNIEETKGEVEKLQAEGVGIGSLIGAVITGLALRGKPSSGPIALVLNRLLGKKED